MKLIVNRDVSLEECPWLDEGIKKGTELYEYTGHTYGCISQEGIACSINGNTPFFELPKNSVDQNNNYEIEK